MGESLLKTPCHDWHAAHGGRMVDFAGWNMPVQYSTITEEHNAVRQAAGLFDIAHMGRLRFTGPDAVRFLQHLLTNDVDSLAAGQIRYSLVTNEGGGILDDVLVYRFDTFHLLVVNASNRLKILDWIERQREGFDVAVDDLTFDWAMLAVQGPRALEIVNEILGSDFTSLKYYYSQEAEVLGRPLIVSRTGYTGEDGCELILPSELAEGTWSALIDSGRDRGLLPAGLGCRDTLRLEAAMPLYGHELSESTDPFTAGLGFAVKLGKGDFCGREALTQKQQQPELPKRVGLELQGRRVAREGAAVLAGGNRIGEVTSGTFSPTLQKPIAMGYVDAQHAAIGTAVEVDIRGKVEPAAVVKLPFYRRPA